jgi:L-lactate dehydrogenase complex protein LldG
MQIPSEAPSRPPPDRVPRFLASLGGLHVEAKVVRNAAETTEALRAIVSKAGCRSAVVAGIPDRYAGAVKAGLAAVKAEDVEALKGLPQKDALGVLAAADAGITWAVHGVALEGALLEVVYDDSFRLASSLPIVHVALLESSSVLADLAEALPVVGGMLRDSPPGKKPAISFISGPSKTGDIEMRLLYGVHGPHTVHALLLDWS